jgi:hypothetical protein
LLRSSPSLVSPLLPLLARLPLKKRLRPKPTPLLSPKTQWPLKAMRWLLKAKQWLLKAKQWLLKAMRWLLKLPLPQLLLLKLLLPNKPLRFSDPA